MFSRTALDAKRADGGNVCVEALLLSAVRAGGELDQRVQGHLHPRRFFLRHVHVVGVNAPQHGLVGDDDDVLAPLQFHDNGFQPDDHVPVAFSTPVPVVVLVVIAGSKVFRVSIGNFLVRKAVTQTRVELVQGLPFELVIAFGRRGQKSGGLNGSLQRRGPDGQMAVVAYGFLHQIREGAGVELAPC